MSYSELLDVITIEDKYNLSESEILNRVADIAAEEAMLNSWTVSSISKRAGPIKSGKYLRYEYELYGQAASRRVIQRLGSVEGTEGSTDKFVAQERSF